MSRYNIDVAHVLSPDLKARVIVQDLLLYAKNTEEKEIALDFSNVKFATRSVMDEIYNVFVKNAKSLPFDVELTNMPENLAALLNVVSRTQTRVKTVPSDAKVIEFKSVDELMAYAASRT